MFIPPKIDDFICNVRWHLNKSLKLIHSNIEYILSDAEQRGMLSGYTYSTILEGAQKGLESGIDAALGELMRTIRTTNLNPNDLREVTVQSLEDFVTHCKAATGADRFQSTPIGNQIDRNLSGFDEILKFKVRQFDVGFLDPQEPEVPQMSNTINIGIMTSSAIQQGSPHADQSVQMTLNIETIQEALATLEAAIQETNLSENVRADVIADISTIRAQLGKPSPNINIIKEAAKSTRSVLEGITAGLLAPSVKAAVLGLWSILGL